MGRVDDRVLSVAALFSTRDRAAAESRFAECAQRQRRAVVDHTEACALLASADHARRAPRETNDARRFDAEQRVRACRYTDAQSLCSQTERQVDVANAALQAARQVLQRAIARDEAIIRARHRRAALRQLALRRRREDFDVARD